MKRERNDQTCVKGCLAGVLKTAAIRRRVICKVTGGSSQSRLQSRACLGVAWNGQFLSSSYARQELTFRVRFTSLGVAVEIVGKLCVDKRAECPGTDALRDGSVHVPGRCRNCRTTQVCGGTCIKWGTTMNAWVLYTLGSPSWSTYQHAGGKGSGPGDSSLVSGQAGGRPIVSSRGVWQYWRGLARS